MIMMIMSLIFRGGILFKENITSLKQGGFWFVHFVYFILCSLILFTLNNKKMLFRCDTKIIVCFMFSMVIAIHQVALILTDSGSCRVEQCWEMYVYLWVIKKCYRAFFIFIIINYII